MRAKKTLVIVCAVLGALVAVEALADRPIARLGTSVLRVRPDQTTSNTKILDLQNGAGTSKASIDIEGDLSCNDLTVAGTFSYTAISATTIAASGNVAVNTDKFTVAAATGNTAVAGTLDVTGNVAVNTDKFTVAAASGNTLVAGTLQVTGASTLSGALAANAGITVDTSAFTVADTSGNVATAGTLACTGNFAVNTDKFAVTAASGNTSVAGTLGVTGNVTVNTDKVVITAASGNTAIAGTLTVGASGTAITNSKVVTVDLTGLSGTNHGVMEASIEDIAMTGVSETAQFIVSVPESVTELGILCRAFYHAADQIGLSCICLAEANCADPGAVNATVRAIW